MILQNVSLDDLRQVIKEEVQTITSTIEKGVKEPKASTDEYLTRKETAEYLKVSLTTLWDLTRKGKLKPYSVGSSVRYRVSELDKAMKGGIL